MADGNATGARKRGSAVPGDRDGGNLPSIDGPDGGEIRICPFCLGVAALLSSSLLYIPASSAPLHIGSLSGHYATFAIPALAGAFAASLGILLYFMRRPAFRVGGTAVLVRSIGLTAFVVGLLGALLSVQAERVSNVALAFSSLLYGAGGVFGYVAWGEVYARLPLRPALANLTLSSVLFVLLEWAIFTLDGIYATVMLVALAALAAILPLVVQQSGPDGLPYREAYGEAYGDAGADDGATAGIGGVREAFAKYLQVLGKPTLCMSVFGMAAFALNSSLWHAGDCAPELIGLLLSVACLAPLFFARFNRPVFPYMYQVTLPAVSLLLLIARLLSSEGWIPFEVYGALYSCIVGLTFMLVFATAAAFARTGDLPVGVVASIGLAIYLASCLVGAVALSLSGGNLDLFTLPSLLLWVACFAYLAFSPGVRAWMSADEPGDRDAGGGESGKGDGAGEGFEARAAEVAETFQLSPRERDILYFLAHGCSSMYISQTLLISDSTVRTHIRSIHRKLGISSRDDLFELMRGR